MRLLFKRNKLISYVKQSGRLCPGFNKCIHPGSVYSNKIQRFKDEPETTIILCRFRKYMGVYSIPLSKLTKAEWEKIEREHTFCWHPDELTHVHEWRCYKCNALVKSERERHRCK